MHSIKLNLRIYCYGTVNCSLFINAVAPRISALFLIFNTIMNTLAEPNIAPDKIITPIQAEKKWYAVYTKPRWEKKVHERLVKYGVESWCPLQKVKKQWSDRKKIVEEPLFRSYGFVHIDHSKDRITVLQVDGVLNFVYYLGKPAIIKDEEINNIKLFLNEKDAQIELRSLEGFKADTKVKVSQGVFKDKEGTILREGKRKVYVQLASIGQLMVVEFSVDHLEKI